MLFPARRTRSFGLALVLSAAGTVAACDTAPTAPWSPAPLVSRQFTPKAIDGDTTSCRSGWVIINGRYECNQT